MRAGRRIRIQQIGTPPPISIRTVDVASDLRAGDPYAGLSLQADGPSSGITWAVTAGELPPGWLLSSEGVVPPGVFAADAQGSYAATVTASAAGFSSDSVLISVDVGYPRIRIVVGAAPSIVPDGVTAYSIPGGIRVEGGSGSFGSMTKSAGNIAPGLSLTGSGVLWNLTGAGTAAGAGQNFLPTFSITDTITSEVATVDIPLSVQPLAAANPLGLTYPVPSPATEGAAFTPLDPVVANAIGTLSYTMAGIMGDVAINPTTGRIYVPDGTLTGATPGASYPLDVVVSDAGTTPARTASYRVNYTVAPLAPPTISVTFSPNPLPTGTPGSAYSATATASGFTGNAVWEVPGVMPAGVTTAVSGANNSVLTWTATSIGAAAANQGFGDILAVSSSLVPSNRTTKAWSIPVGPLPSAFEAPSLITSPAMIEYDADQDGSSSLAAASYVDPGSLAASAIKVQWRAKTALQPGVALGPEVTGAGSVTTSYDRDAGVNAQADATLALVVGYEDPTVGGGNTQFTVTEREAEWAAQKAEDGVHRVLDFSVTNYPTLVDFIAASANATGNTPLTGVYEHGLDRANWLTGGQSFTLTIFDKATNQGGCWAGNYGFNPYDYRPFWVQVVMELDENAMGWIPQDASGGLAGGGLGNKVMYFKNNSSDGGQTYLSMGGGTGGFPQFNVENNTVIQAARTGMTGGQSGTGYFFHNCIDNGAPTGTDVRERMQRYGLERRAVGLGVAEERTVSADATVPLFTRRAGYPQADAIAGGSFCAEHGRPFVVTMYCDPAPRDIFPPDGSGPGGRIARVVYWMSHYGQPAIVLADTFDPLVPHYDPPPHIDPNTNQVMAAGHDRHYITLRFQNVFTDRVAELGVRPPMKITYHRGAIISHKEIRHPHQPGPLPVSPFGPCIEYPGYPGGY